MNYSLLIENMAVILSVQALKKCKSITIKKPGRTQI